MIKVKVGQVYEVMGKRKEVNGVFPERGLASFRRNGLSFYQPRWNSAARDGG